jgi:regulatory factor X
MDIKPSNPRSRSNTAASGKSRKRPLSRASTTSIHSGATQPLLEQQLVDTAAEFQKQWYDANTQAQQRYDMNHQMSPEDMVIHSAAQLQNPREYEIDPALGGAQHNPMTYPKMVHIGLILAVIPCLGMGTVQTMEREIVN